MRSARATPEERAAALLRATRAQVRQHMNALAGKAYWDAVRRASPELVVMFIPGEVVRGGRRRGRTAR